MTTEADLHPADGDLMGYLDGAAEPAERTAIGQHLAGCSECSGRLDAMRRRARDLSNLLRRTDPALPRRRTVDARRRFRFRIPRPLRPAAVFVLLAGTAVGVRPVRAWIVEHGRSLWSLMIAGPRNPSVGMIETRADESAGSVSFRPVTTALQIEIARRQATGTLVIEGSNAAMTSLAITTGARNETLVVLPVGVRIANDGNSRASYHLRLAATTTQVVVQISGESPVVFQPIRPTDRWSLNLVR